MKYTLYFLLWICAVSIALTGSNVQAARGKPKAKTALVVGPSAPSMVCPQEFPSDLQLADELPEFSFSEPAHTYADGYRYDNPEGFACFVPEMDDAQRAEQSRVHWLTTIRLLPTFPQIDNTFFLPIGWEWITFDR